MKVPSILRLTLCATLFASLACSGDKAAAVPDGAAPGADATAASADKTPAATPAPSDPAAVIAAVNGKKITEGDLETAVKLYAQSQGLNQQLPPDQKAEVRKFVLDGLIDRELLYQKSVADGIKPDQAEIDSVLKQARQAYPDDAEWTKHLNEQGLPDDAAFTDIVVRSLSIEQVVKQVTTGDQATEAEARKYYDEHPDEMKMPEKVRASHILFRFPEGTGDAGKASVKAKADAALAELKAGGDFAALAKSRSEDPGSAPNGGDLGFFSKGRMVPEFENVAFSLSVGQISDVFESKFGYHIMKVTDKQPAKQASFDEVRENLTNFLTQKKAREGLQNLLASLRTSAKIETF